MYNIKAVSKILDMPSVTIRSWETRYHAISPERTSSGHRMYTEEDVNDLIWLKKQVQENGINISQAVELLKEQKVRSTESSTPRAQQGFDIQIQDLFEAVVNLDAHTCEFLFDLYFSQFHYRTVLFSIMVPLLYKVGEAWEKGELHVANEHMISNIALQRCTKIMSIFNTSPSLPRVMAICPSGEQHQIGLMLFTLFLREQHHPVYYIGADTPLEGIETLIKKKNINILVISTSRSEDERLIQQYVDTLSQQIPHLKFVVGGLGIKERHIEPPRWNIPANDPNWSLIWNEIIQ